MILITGREVERLLKGQEEAIINAVRLAYEAHGKGSASLPHSSFLRFEIAGSPEAVLTSCSLVSFATTASKPHIFELNSPQGSTILHISLRDLSPEVILSCNNVVDDVDHVCRAETSIHLAFQRAGNTGFINCALPELLLGPDRVSIEPERVTVFSPFGLGILDLAVGTYVVDRARQQGLGLSIDSFFPDAWSEV
jgi:ornithine cyclodeaminase